MEEKRLKELIQGGESDDLEFKDSLKLNNEIGQTVSGFSNSNGGTILVGVTDTGEVSGVEIGDSTLERLANQIKQNTDPQTYPKITTKNIEGKDIVIIQVKESQEKPVFYRDKAYKRVGKSTHRLNSSEIRRLAKNSGKKLHWDEQICEEASLEDIEEEKVKWYLERREDVSGNTKPSDMSLTDLLYNIGAVKKTGGNFKPTNAGILFFAEKPQRYIPQSRLRAAKFSGREVTRDFLDKDDFEGSVWEIVDDVEKFFRNNMKTFGFRTDLDFKRIDKQEYPIVALRECVINALIHRDYKRSGDTRVLMFDDRIEIVNPGSFPEGVTPKNPKHVPVNPVLSKLMYDVGLVEKYGTGIYMIREKCEEHGMPEPEYNIGPIETKVIFRSPGKAVLLSELEERTDINQRMREGLKYALREGSISNKEYRKINDVSHDTANNELTKLSDLDLLNRVGKGRATKYKPNI